VTLPSGRKTISPSSAFERLRASRHGARREGRAHRTAIDTDEGIRPVDRGRLEAVATAETGAEDDAAADLQNRITSTLRYEIVGRPPNGPRINCGASSACALTYVSLERPRRRLHALGPVGPPLSGDPQQQ
jgi:hypothetical protein